MPLWAIILLHYWRAVGEGRRAYWLPLAVEIGLLLLTTYVGLILVGLLVLFTLANKRARAALSSYDPLIAAVVAGIVIGPHLIWLADSGGELMPMLVRLRNTGSGGRQSRRLAAPDRIDPRRRMPASSFWSRWSRAGRGRGAIRRR